MWTAADRRGKFGNIFEYFSSCCTEHPDKLYLIDNETRSYTWKESLDFVEAVAKSLAVFLKKPGATVSILSDNCAEWVLTDLGIIRSGHISTPLFTTMTCEKFLYSIQFTKVNVIFVGHAENWAEVAESIPDDVILISMPHIDHIPGTLKFSEFLSMGTGHSLPDIANEDKVCMLTFTSGTTGNPKAVMHSLDSLLQMGLIFQDMTHQAELSECRFLCYLPLSHIGEKVVSVVHSLLVGASISFNHSQAGFVNDLRSTRPTMVLGVPRIWEKLLQLVVSQFASSSEDLKKQLSQDGKESLIKRIRAFLGLNDAIYLISSSAITPRSTKEWYQLIGIRIADIYGQTEILPITSQKPGRSVMGSVGSATPGFEVRIGEGGEIIGRGPGMALGYYNDPERTRETFRDGWVYTGDKGYLDEEANLFVIGRIQDTFKTAKGKYVAPGPIEDRFSKIDVVEQQSLYGLGLTQPIMLCTVGVSAAGMDIGSIESVLLRITAEINQTIEPHERIGAIIVSRAQWTSDDGILTHTHKVIRDKVFQHYEQDIDNIAKRLSKGERNIIQWA